MIKLISTAILVLSFIIATPVLSRADSKSVTSQKIDANTWKEMQRVSGIIKTQREVHKKGGTDPDAFYATVETSLSYRMIAIVAYKKPKTVDEAKRGATIDIDVLAKALYEYNRRSGVGDTKSCLLASCMKRMVYIALTQEGLGIHDAPIMNNIEYSTRIIYPQ